MSEVVGEEFGVHPAVARAAGLRWARGKWYVERTVPDRFKRTEGLLEVKPFVTAPCYVSAKDGATISTAPYESIRLEIGMSLPCYAGELEAAYEFVSQWVAERLAKERDEVIKTFASET